MAVLGVGMGLIASQLGNVVQSSVDASGRGEAGGLQYTGQQLGLLARRRAHRRDRAHRASPARSSTNIQDDDRISAEVSDQVGVAVESGIDFVASPIRSRPPRRRPGSTRRRPRRSSTTTSRRSSRRSRPACSAAALLALVSLAFTRDLPHERPIREESPAEPVEAA